MVVLLGPALGYLLIFSLFPLLYSLGILSFYEFDVIESDWEFVGLFGSLCWSDDVFWAQHGRQPGWSAWESSCSRLRHGAGVVLQPPTAWRGARARAARWAMILNPVVVGLMWRALLNPDWGLVNWMLGGLGIDSPPNWLGDPAVAKAPTSSMSGSGLPSSSSSCSPGSRGSG